MLNVIRPFCYCTSKQPKSQAERALHNWPCKTNPRMMSIVKALELFIDKLSPKLHPTSLLLGGISGRQPRVVVVGGGRGEERSQNNESEEQVEEGKISFALPYFPHLASASSTGGISKPILPSTYFGITKDFARAEKNGRIMTLN